jgi:hypothetical protein
MYPHERSLVKRLADKPFALLGINSDADRAKLKEAMRTENITWRSWWDGGNPEGPTDGPIANAWNIGSWPTIYVLDHKGVIRFKDVRGEAMDKAVDQLLKEMEAEQTPKSGAKERQVKDNVIVSTELPAIRIEVDKSLKHVGNLHFDLNKVAHVERVIFVDADQERIKRMFIVQFEGFLEGVNASYNYPLHNPLTLGKHTYGSDLFLRDVAEYIRKNPAAEQARTTAFLKEKGYQHADMQMMARFCRIVGDAKRHEILLFYFENADVAGLSAADFDKQGNVLEAKKPLTQAFRERALKSFTITD